MNKLYFIHFIIYKYIINSNVVLNIINLKMIFSYLDLLLINWLKFWTYLEISFYEYYQITINIKIIYLHQQYHLLNKYL